MSLAVVGAAHPNKRGPSRRFGIALCALGDRVELRREPKNEHDEHAIAVFAHDVQLGYVNSERAALIAPMIDRGREIGVIFQEATRYGCVIRVAFDGEVPALPPSQTANECGHTDPDFWPDPEYGD